MPRRLLVVIGTPLLTFALLFAGIGTAMAEGYFDKVAKNFGTSKVYIDPKAVLGIKPDKAYLLNQQISESPIPIYLAQIDKKQVPGQDPQQWPVLLHAAVNQPGIYAVFADRFIAQGFDISPQMKEQAKMLAAQAYTSQTFNPMTTPLGQAVSPYEVLKNYVAAIEATQKPPAPTFMSSLSTKAMLIVLAVAIILILLLRYVIPERRDYEA